MLAGICADTALVGGKLAMSFVCLVGSVSVAGCGSASTHSPVARREASICRSLILRAGSHSYTTPGSYVDRGPGSCTSADLTGLLALVSRFRHAVLTAGDVCAVLPAGYRRTAQQRAAASRLTCSQAALRSGNATVGDVAQPLGQIRILSVDGAPSRKGGFVIFQRNPREQGALGGNPLVLAVSKHGGAWTLDRIGYQF